MTQQTLTEGQQRDLARLLITRHTFHEDRAVRHSPDDCDACNQRTAYRNLRGSNIGHRRALEIILGDVGALEGSPGA